MIDETLKAFTEDMALSDRAIHAVARLATRIVAKASAYTYPFYVKRLPGFPYGRFKNLWPRVPRNSHQGAGCLYFHKAGPRTCGPRN